MSTPKLPAVARLRPVDAEELLGMLEELTRRVDFLASAAERHEQRLADTVTVLGDQAARLAAIEAANAPKPKLADVVEEFVNAHPGLKFTALVVGESMGLTSRADQNRINSSLATLAANGRIAVDTREGRNRVYFAKPAARCV